MDLFLSFLSPIATLAKSLWARATLHWRAARLVVKDAREADVRLSLKQVRRALESGDVLRSFRVTSTEERQRTGEALFARLGCKPADGWDPSALLSLVEDAYLRVLDEPNSRHLNRNGTLAAVERGLNAVSATMAVQNSDLSLFASRLKELPALRSSVLQEIRDSWPQGPMALGRILDAKNRRQLFTDWASDEPTWLANAPARALAWLGSMASDYEANDAAVRFLDRALDEGVSPRGYWRVRRLWASPVESAEDIQSYLKPDEDHPLAAMVIASTHSKPETLPAMLESWKPNSLEEQITLAVVRAQLAENRNDFDEAIHAGLDGYKRLGSVGAGLIAARALLARNLSNPSLLTRSDVADAKDLALRLRDDRRIFGMSSADAVSIAALACQLLSDPMSAWRLTQLPPVGEATESEAGSQIVRDRALLIAAEQGVDEADRLIASTDDPFMSTKARALLAGRTSDSTEAIRLWTETLELAKDPKEKTQAAASLAALGVEHSFLDELAELNPEMAADIRQTAQLFSGAPEGLAAAVVAARSSQISAFNLMNYYSRSGQTEAAATLAVSSAQRWPDADTWRRAATLHEELDDIPRAIEYARAALLEGGTAWGAATDCHFLLVRCYSRLEDWDNATKAAADLVTTDSNSDWARWILVICQLSSGNGDAALASWQADGRRPRAENRQQVLAWIELFQLFGESVGSTAELVELSTMWKEDEEVRRHIVGALIFGKHQSSDDSAASILPAYLEDFPDANFLIPITIDEERPLESLKEAFDKLVDPSDEAVRLAATRELEGQVLRAELPLGMISFAHNVSYSEAVVLRGSHYRFAGPANLNQEVEDVASTVTRTVVADTTAMFTQVLLAPSMGAALSGLFADLLVTAEQYRDANRGNQSLQSSSRLRFNPGGPDEEPTATSLTQDELESRKELASRLWSAFGTARRVAHPNLVGLTGMSNSDETGESDPRAARERRQRFNLAFSAADHAVAASHAFWSDDIVLRRMAREFSVPTFGTPAVIEYLRQSGESDARVLSVAEATLVSNYYLGVAFRVEVYELAADMDGVEGRGTLAAMIKSGGDNGPLRIAFALRQMAKRSENPEFLRDWARGIATWLTNVSGGEGPSNLTVWARNLFEASWMSQSSFPFVFEGLKAASLEILGTADPLFEAFHQYYRNLSEQAAFDVAAAYSIALVSRLSDEDRSRVVGQIISDSD